MRARAVAVGLLAGLGVLIGGLWGWSALVVYAVLAAITGVVVYAIGLGGEWLRDLSSRRFDDRR